MAISSGLYRTVAAKLEPTFGTVDVTATGAQYLRRTGVSLVLNKKTFESAEINAHQQMVDYRHGSQEVAGSIDGELSPGTYSMMWASLFRQASTAVVTTGAQTDISALAGPPGTFTTAGAVNFLTLGFKVGDVVRCSGWTTTGAVNNAVNYRITALTATVMTVGTAASGAAGQPEVVGAKLAGDSVIIVQAGKKQLMATTSHTKTSFAIEDWASDVSRSRLYTGCRVSGASINIPASGMATVKFDFMGQGLTSATSQYYTSPTAQTTARLLAGSQGKLRVNGADIATVTALSFNIAGGHSTGETLGSGLTPDVFPGILKVTGQVSVYYENSALLANFTAEDEIGIVSMMTTTSAVNADFMTFNLPRVKLGGNSLDDGAKGVIQTIPFTALYNKDGGSGISSDLSTLIIQDSLLA